LFGSTVGPEGSRSTTCAPVPRRSHRTESRCAHRRRGLHAAAQSPSGNGDRQLAKPLAHLRTFGVSTLADGIAVKAPGSITMPIIKEKASDTLLVDEGDIEQAIVMLLEIEKRA
jgi:hypothetical protein